MCDPVYRYSSMSDPEVSAPTELQASWCHAKKPSTHTHKRGPRTNLSGASPAPSHRPQFSRFLSHTIPPNINAYLWVLNALLTVTCFPRRHYDTLCNKTLISGSKACDLYRLRYIYFKLISYSDLWTMVFLQIIKKKYFVYNLIGSFQHM